MPEEANQDPAIEQDTPTTPEAQDTPTEAPEQTDTGNTQEEVDIEKRLHDAQAWGTKSAQEAAELREYIQVSELARQGNREAQQYLHENYEGWPEPEADTEDDYEAEQPVTRAELREWQEQEQAEKQAAANEQAFHNALWEQVQAIEEKIGREVTDQEAQVLQDSADAQVGRTGQFDLNSTWEIIAAQEKAAVERYVNSKKTAPLPPLGSAGDESIDLNDEEARQAKLAEIMNAASEREA